MEVVFLVWLAVCLSMSLASYSIPRNVYISFLSPRVTSQEKQAVLSAISQVNLDSSLLPNTTLHLTDSASPSQNPFIGAWNISQNKISSLIMSSKPTESHDTLSSMLQIPLFSTRQSKAAPLNHSFSGYGVKMVSSTHMAMVDLISKYSWTNLIVLYDVRFRDEVSAFVSNLPSNVHCHVENMVLDQSGLLNKTTEHKLSILAADTAEAIAVFCDASLVQRVLIQVHPLLSHKKHRSHRWLLAEPIGSFDLVADISQVVIGFAPRVVVNPKTTALIAALSANVTTTTFSSFLVFDAVLAYAHALHNMLLANRWQTLPVGSNIVEFINGPELLKYIKKVSAAGTTGLIEFNNGSHRRNAVMDVLNLRGGVFSKIGEWSETTGLTMTSAPQKNKPVVKVVPLSQLQRKLKIALVEDPPFVMIEFDPQTNENKLVGYSVDLVKGIAEILHFQYEFYLSPDGKYGGTNPDGSLSGVLGEVHRQKADMSSMPLTISSDRLQYIGFSKPFMYISMDLVMKRPQVKEFDITGFMTPYTIMVWWMTLVTWFVVTAILTLVNYFSPYGHRLCDEEQNGDEFSWFNSLWFCLASMLQQGGDDTPRMLSGRIVVGSFWFCVLVWVSTYTANLAAFLTSSKNDIQLTTLEAVQEGDYRLYIMRDTALYEYFKTADYRLYRLLWERMSTEKTFVDSASEAFAKVRNQERTVYLEESPFAEYLVNQEPCDVMSTKDVTGSSSYGIAMSKDFPYINNISIAILKMQELGQLGDLKRKWWDQRNRCPNYVQLTTEEVIESQRIQIGSMVGVYLLLAAGGVISIVVIFVEVWWKNRRDKIRAKVRQGWVVVRGAKTVIGLQQKSKADASTVVQAFQIPSKRDGKDVVQTFQIPPKADSKTAVKAFSIPPNTSLQKTEHRDLGITNKGYDEVPIKIPASLDLWGVGTKSTSENRVSEKPAKMRATKDHGMYQSSKAVPPESKSEDRHNNVPNRDLGLGNDMNDARPKVSSNRGDVSKTKSSNQPKKYTSQVDAKTNGADFPAKSSLDPKAPKSKSSRPKDASKDKAKELDKPNSDKSLNSNPSDKGKSSKNKEKRKARKEGKDDKA